MRRFSFFFGVCALFFLLGHLLTAWGEFLLPKLVAVNYAHDTYLLVESGEEHIISPLLPLLSVSAISALFFTFLSFGALPKTAHEFRFLRARITPHFLQSVLLLCLFQTLAWLPLVALRLFPSLWRYHAYPPEMQFFEMLSVSPLLATIFALFYLFHKAHRT